MDGPSALPPGPLTVAAGQAACAALDVPANIAVAADLVRRAADQGADMLVLPELFLTGYELSAVVADPGAYTVDAGDPRLDPLAAACAETRTAVMVGAPTRDPGAELAGAGSADPGAGSADPGPGAAGLRISALVLGCDGRFAARYDKQHPTANERAAGVRPGTSGCTVTVNGWRLGLGICSDSGYPEHARAAALDGCCAYLVGAMFDRSDGAHKRATYFPARALDNTSYVLLANHSGPSGPYHGCGRSSVWNPDGTLLVDADVADPGLAVARLDPQVLARTRAGSPVLVDPSLTAPVHPRHDVTLD